MVIGMDELDIAPKDGPKFQPPPMTTAADFVKALDAAVEKGRAALRGTNDADLATHGKLLAGGKASRTPPATSRSATASSPTGCTIAASSGLLQDARHPRSVHLRPLRRRASSEERRLRLRGDLPFGHGPRLVRVRTRPRPWSPRRAPAPAARPSSLPPVGRLFAPRKNQAGTRLMGY